MIDRTMLCRGVPFSAPSHGRWPLHVIRLGDVGLDEQFLHSIRPSFDRAQWDHYDVLSGTLQFLLRQPGAVAAEAARILEMADADDRRTAVNALLDTVPAALRDEVATFRPHRRRAFRHYALERTTTGEWAIDALEDTTFKQAVSDYRGTPRTFARMEDDVAAHSGVLALLASAAETAHRARPDVRRIDAYAHQVTTFARPRHSGSPAPEGLHQDGADFIVSALVVERANVRGGVSRVYEGRGHGTPVLEIELQAGEGIFQMDAGSDLWHEISSVEVVDPATEGHRMILGFDLHVV
jgi:hypothetical protein